MTPPSKTCASCGRTIEWRKKWERDWDDVRYCSTACRKRGVTEVDRQLEAAIEKLLTGRNTISPDDAARSVGDEQALREPARRAARRLVNAGRIQFVQRGRVVDPSTAKGDVQLRRAR